MRIIRRAHKIFWDSGYISTGEVRYSKLSQGKQNRRGIKMAAGIIPSPFCGCRSLKFTRRVSRGVFAGLVRFCTGDG